MESNLLRDRLEVKILVKIIIDQFITLSKVHNTSNSKVPLLQTQGNHGTIRWIILQSVF
jgi:hypothetical protein